MTQVIKRFLVGLGFDTKEFDEGQRDVTAGLGNMRGAVLTTSAALIGAFGAAATSVINTANKIDDLALKTSNLKTPTQFVYDYGNALKTLGGDADEALSAVSAIEETLNNLRVRGEMGALNDLALAGIDVSRLREAPDAQEFLRILAEQMPSMDMGQRAVARDALGLSDAALKSLVNGVDQFDAAIARAQDLTGNIEGLVENSRKLNEATAELGLTVEGIRNELAEKLLPSLAGVASRLNNFLIENKDAIQQSGESLQYAPFTAPFIWGMRYFGRPDEDEPKMGAPSASSGIFDNAPEPLDQGSSRSIFDPAPEQGPNGYNRNPEFYNESMPVREWFDSSSSVAPETMRERERQDSANALAGALNRSPIKVDNRIDMNVQLDGQAIEAKIIDVNERQNFDSLEDIRTTTDR